jgi:hypothetical protein
MSGPAASFRSSVDWSGSGSYCGIGPAGFGTAGFVLRDLYCGIGAAGSLGVVICRLLLARQQECVVTADQTSPPPAMTVAQKVVEKASQSV